MNARNIATKVTMLTGLTIATWQLATPALADDKGDKDDTKGKKKAMASFTVQDLQKRKGPNPPSDAVRLGIAAQPAVGELTLPIHDVPVYEFVTTTKDGKDLFVKWAYQKESGTYLWGTTRITCGDQTIARGGFVAHVKDDGSGGYALGTNQCAVGAAYGCRFDAKGKETQCGACKWTANELVCAED